MVSKHLIRASRIMGWLSVAGAVFYLIGEISVFLFPDLSRAIGFFEVHLGAGAIQISDATPFAFRLAAMLVELIPASLLIWALLSLRKLFFLYAKGAVFSGEATVALARVTALMFWQVFASAVTQAPVSLLLSWPTDHRSISLGIGSDDLSFLFLAGVALVVARAMCEAKRIADENAGFV